MMWETFHVMMQTMTIDQKVQASHSPSTMVEAKYLQSLGRYDPLIFNNRTSQDLTVRELGLSSMNTIFYLTNCQNDEKVLHASLLL